MHPVPALNSPAIPVVNPLKQLTTLHAPSSSSQLTCNTCREPTKATNHTACTQFQLSTHLHIPVMNPLNSTHHTACTQFQLSTHLQYIPVVNPLKQLTTLHAPSSSSQLTCNTCRETTTQLTTLHAPSSSSQLTCNTCRETTTQLTTLHAPSSSSQLTCNTCREPTTQLTTLHAPSSSSQLTCNTCRETTKATHHTACTQFQLSTHLPYLS